MNYYLEVKIRNSWNQYCYKILPLGFKRITGSLDTGVFLALYSCEPTPRKKQTSLRKPLFCQCWRAPLSMMYHRWYREDTVNGGAVACKAMRESSGLAPVYLVTKSQVGLFHLSSVHWLCFLVVCLWGTNQHAFMVTHMDLFAYSISPITSDLNLTPHAPHAQGLIR